jgi:hypothetical protein
MTGKNPRFALLALLIAATAGIALAVEGQNPAPAKAPWRIVGQLEEACSCSAACPCWFGSKPTRMTCGGGQVLFIEKGTYGGVSLDGLAIANMAQSPAGKGMMESFGSWTFSYLYLDEKAKPDQRQALEAIGRTILPVKASTNVEVRVAPITRAVDGKEHTVSIGQYGSFAAHLLQGGMGGAVKIVNPPGADPLHKEYEQGTTTKLAYNDAGQNWNIGGSNYMFGTFALDSVQYEKYAAGLAQKMQEKK